MNSNYKATISETSRKLTAKERIAVLNGMGAQSLDAATQVEDVVIHPDYYAILNVHNEKSDNKDYVNFIVVDKSGAAYVTGSESFISSFTAIYDEMEKANAEAIEAGEDPEDYEIVVYRQESKNYKGKTFITCKIR